MNNLEIRMAIKNARLFNYEVAAELGLSETSFSRKLRKELPAEEKEKILSAIERLARGAANVRNS